MGLATAKLVASRGAIVSMADINEAALQTAIESLPASEKHIYTIIDVRDSSQVDSWIQSTVERLGKLDGAVNMAGVISPAKPITETTDETWNFNFGVNSTGLFYCLRAQLRAISAGGSIVSSHVGFTLQDLADLECRLMLPVLLARWAHLEFPHTVLAKQQLLGYHEQRPRRTRIFE